ncbi:MAG: hypothetical protein K2X25_12575 [Caulobacteraceae bacterium]|nr:hypothetical protein [Caulobacteraceae bacterium]
MKRTTAIPVLALMALTTLPACAPTTRTLEEFHAGRGSQMMGQGPRPADTCASDQATRERTRPVYRGTVC